MSHDNMSQYSGIAASYAELPLIALRELESVLQIEIRGRLEGFGEGVGENGVGDFEGENVSKDSGNYTKNNVFQLNRKGV